MPTPLDVGQVDIPGQLKALGYDPDRFTMVQEGEGMRVTPISSIGQPSAMMGHQQPGFGGNNAESISQQPQPTTAQPASSFWGSTLRDVMQNAIPNVGGGAAAGKVGMPLGTAIGAGIGGLVTKSPGGIELGGQIGSLIGGVGTGIAGQYGTGKAENAIEKAVMSPEQYAGWQQQLATDQAQHPGAELLAHTIEPFFGGFSPNFKSMPQDAKTAIQMLGRAVGMGSVNPATAAKQAVVNRLLNAGIQGGIGGVQDYAQQQQSGQPISTGQLVKSIAEQAAIGGIYSDVNKLGEKLGFPASGNRVPNEIEQMVGQKTQGNQATIQANKPQTTALSPKEAAAQAKAREEFDMADSDQAPLIPFTATRPGKTEGEVEYVRDRDELDNYLKEKAPGLLKQTYTPEEPGEAKQTVGLDEATLRRMADEHMFGTEDKSGQGGLPPGTFDDRAAAEVEAQRAPKTTGEIGVIKEATSNFIPTFGDPELEALNNEALRRSAKNSNVNEVPPEPTLKQSKTPPPALGQEAGQKPLEGSDDSQEFKKLQARMSGLDLNHPNFEKDYNDILGQMETIKNRNNGYVPGTEPSQAPREQPASITPVPKSKEKAAAAKAAGATTKDPEGKIVPLWADWATRLFKAAGVQRNIRIEPTTGKLVNEAGLPINGISYLRDGVKEAIAKMTYKQLDTFFHEPGGHIFFHDLLNSPHLQDREAAQHMLDTVDKSPDLVKWTAQELARKKIEGVTPQEAIADPTKMGLPSSKTGRNGAERGVHEEFLAEHAGQYFKQHAGESISGFKQAYKEMLSAAKLRYGNATTEDAFRLLHNRFFKDAPFYETHLKPQASSAYAGQVREREQHGEREPDHYIVKAAVKAPDGTINAAPTTEGFNNHYQASYYREDSERQGHTIYDGIRGFIDNKGNFLTRKEALPVAIKAEQLWDDAQFYGPLKELDTAHLKNGYNQFDKQAPREQPTLEEELFNARLYKKQKQDGNERGYISEFTRKLGEANDAKQYLTQEQAKDIIQQRVEDAADKAKKLGYNESINTLDDANVFLQKLKDKHQASTPREQPTGVLPLDEGYKKQEDAYYKSVETLNKAHAEHSRVLNRYEEGSPEELEARSNVEAAMNKHQDQWETSHSYSQQLNPPSTARNQEAGQKSIYTGPEQYKYADKDSYVEPEDKTIGAIRTHAQTIGKALFPDESPSQQEILGMHGARAIAKGDEPLASDTIHDLVKSGQLKNNERLPFRRAVTSAYETWKAARPGRQQEEGQEPIKEQKDRGASGSGVEGRLFLPTASSIDSLRRSIPGEQGGHIADQFTKLYNEQQAMTGKYENQFSGLVKELSPTQRTNVRQALEATRDQQQDMTSSLRTTKEQQAYTQIRNLLGKMGEERGPEGTDQPVITSNGNKRHFQQDENFFPSILGKEQADTLRVNSPADADKIEQWHQDWMKHQQDNGATEKQAQDRWDDLISSIRGDLANRKAGGNDSYFNGIRKQEGISLPPSMRETDLGKALQSYSHRFGADYSWYKHVESNPEMAASMGYKEDGWGKPLDEDVRQANPSQMGNSKVQDITEHYRGEVGSSVFGRPNARALEHATTVGILGPGTQIHKVIASTAQGVSYFTSNPVEATKALVNGLTHYAEGYARAVDVGGTRVSPKTAMDNFRMLVDTGSSMADRFKSLSDLAYKTYTAGGLTDRIMTGNLQIVGEHIMAGKIAKASTGDADAAKFLRYYDPDYEVGKTYSPEEIQTMASRLANTIHGSGDPRTLPGYMTKDTEISAFLHLAHWNISSTNAWMRNVWTPATKGNFVPLMMSALGSTLGGYAIKKMKEEVLDTKTPVPDITEIMASNANKEKGLYGRSYKENMDNIAYAAMELNSLAGFGGIMSSALKGTMDVMHKNKFAGMGTVFPLDEVASSTAEHIGNMLAAFKNGDTSWLNIAGKALTDWTKQNVQVARVAMTAAERASGGEVFPQDYQRHLQTQKEQDLRRYQEVSGLPYEDQSLMGAVNPYTTLGAQQFHRNMDLKQAVTEQLPPLVHNLIGKYGDKPQVLLDRLDALKKNGYQTVPDPEEKAPEFASYYNYMKMTQGQQAATDRVIDYMKHKIANEAKSGVIP